jgi:hypothetical protein
MLEPPESAGISGKLGMWRKGSRSIAALAAAVGLCAGAARAQPGDTVATFYGVTDAFPSLNVAGAPQAFLCLTFERPAAPRQECYAFYPDPGAISRIDLSNNGALVREGSVWTEYPGAYHFAQRPAPKGQVSLYDTSRNIAWVLATPSGGSMIAWPGVAKPWYGVRGVTYPPGASAYVGGPALPPEFTESPRAPAAAKATFTRRITATQRAVLLQQMAAWNVTVRPLTTSNGLDLIDGEAAALGLMRPSRYAAQTPIQYVEGLAALNR